MAVIRPIFRAALLATVLGLLLTLAVPGGDRVADIGAAICAVATWILPLLVLALSWIRKPKGSLAQVGVFISAFVFAAVASVAGLALATLSLCLARSVEWAGWSLLVIAAFWLSATLVIAIGGRRAPQRDKENQAGGGRS